MKSVPSKWDVEVDLICAGGSGGGLVAALVGHDLGLKTLLLEKSYALGGGTALSGGIIWIPNNHHMKKWNVADSREDALTYIRRISMGKHDEGQAAAYVDNAPEMLRYVEEHTSLRMKLPKNYPDYRAELPGGKMTGRYLLPDPLNMGIMLGEAERKWPFLGKVRRPAAPLQLGIPEGIWAAGRTLIGPLVLACLERGIEMMTETRARDLIVQDGRVVGLRAEKGGRDFFVKANRAVLLATGGFEWNEAMNKRFIAGPEVHPYTNPQNEGDGHLMGMELGAAVALMNQTIGCPTCRVPGEEIDGRPLYRLFVGSIGKPGDITVDRHGKRCCNESFYPDMVKAWESFDAVKAEPAHLPLYWIADRSHRERYFCGPLAPGQDEGNAEWIQKADSIKELAKKLGLSPDQLHETVERFNRFAKEGKDPDFHRGENAYDRWSGDPNRKPSAALAPLVKKPFYGVQIHPGTAGHRGGLVTNPHAQVLRLNGEVIPGLYGTSNTTAHLAMGVCYNSGFAVGQSMTFGYIAAKHISETKKS